MPWSVACIENSVRTALHVTFTKWAFFARILSGGESFGNCSVLGERVGYRGVAEIRSDESHLPIIKTKYTTKYEIKCEHQRFDTNIHR